MLFQRTGMERCYSSAATAPGKRPTKRAVNTSATSPGHARCILTTDKRTPHPQRQAVRRRQVVPVRRLVLLHGVHVGEQPAAFKSDQARRPERAPTRSSLTSTRQAATRHVDPAPPAARSRPIDAHTFKTGAGKRSRMTRPGSSRARPRGGARPAASARGRWPTPAGEPRRAVRAKGARRRTPIV